MRDSRDAVCADCGHYEGYHNVETGACQWFDCKCAPGLAPADLAPAERRSLEATAEYERTHGPDLYNHGEEDAPWRASYFWMRGQRDQALALVGDLIAYSHLREKVRLREDQTEYEEAEKLIARADALACPGCGMTAQVEPSRSEAGCWMCNGCAQPFDVDRGSGFESPGCLPGAPGEPLERRGGLASRHPGTSPSVAGNNLAHERAIGQVAHGLALRLIESDRYSRMPKAVQRWAYRYTSVGDRASRNMRKHADIVERLGR